MLASDFYINCASRGYIGTLLLPNFDIHMNQILYDIHIENVLNLKEGFQLGLNQHCSHSELLSIGGHELDAAVGILKPM